MIVYTIIGDGELGKKGSQSQILMFLDVCNVEGEVWKVAMESPFKPDILKGKVALVDRKSVV